MEAPNKHANMLEHCMHIVVDKKASFFLRL